MPGIGIDMAARRRGGLTVLAAIVAVTTLAGCNTVAGAGRDLEALGRTMSDTAERARP
jgi:predicted small secreted protein